MGRALLLIILLLTTCGLLCARQPTFVDRHTQEILELYHEANMRLARQNISADKHPQPWNFIDPNVFWQKCSPLKLALVLISGAVRDSLLARPTPGFADRNFPQMPTCRLD